MSSLTDVVASIVPGISSGTTDEGGTADRILDYNKVIKQLVVHESEGPLNKETPYFNHHAFFASLNHYNGKFRDTTGEFGKYLLYGEVVTSTNTMLEKYVHFPPHTAALHLVSQALRPIR